MTDQLQQEVAALRTEVKALRTDVHDLVDAWRTARGVVRFVKWLAGLTTAATTVWALVKLALGAKA